MLLVKNSPRQMAILGKKRWQVRSKIRPRLAKSLLLLCTPIWGVLPLCSSNYLLTHTTNIHHWGALANICANCYIYTNESGIVCELDGKLTIRSYFSNCRTEQRQWDEPPSGASQVKHASETMQKMAKIQLQEMQIATGNIPDTAAAKAPAKKSGFGFFRRSSSKADVNAVPKGDATSKTKIQYRSDSFLARTKKDSKKSQQKYDEQLDLNMQQALASSMHSGGTEGTNQDDELERALAMSRAENSSHGRSRSRSRDSTPVRGSAARGSTPVRDSRGRSSQRSLSRTRSASNVAAASGAGASGVAKERPPVMRLPPGGPPKSRSADRDEGSSHPRFIPGEGSSHRRTLPSEGSSHNRTLPSEGSSHRRTLPSEGSSHRRTFASEGSSHQRSHPPPVPDEKATKKIAPVEPKPDPPAADEMNPTDGSIVRFEFSHDEEEAMAMAMSLSLMEFEKTEKVEGEPKPPAAAVAKLPSAEEEEEDLKGMTEEELLSIALSKSMAAAAPEHKSAHGSTGVNETKTPEVDDDEDDQKMPADERFVARNIPNNDSEAVTINSEEVKSSATEPTYVVSLNDIEDEKPRDTTRGNPLQKLNCMTRRLSGSHLGYSTAPATHSTSKEGTRTRSLSPGPGPGGASERKSSRSPSTRSRSPKTVDPMHLSSRSQSSRSSGHSSHSRSHSPKSPNSANRSSHSRTNSPKASPVDSTMRHSSRGPRSHSPKTSPIDGSMRHSSRGGRSRSPRPTGGTSLGDSSPLRNKDTGHKVTPHGPSVPDITSGTKAPAGDPKAAHHRGKQGEGAPRRRLTKKEVAMREEKMLQKAMKESLRDVGAAAAAPKPSTSEKPRGEKPQGQRPRRKLTEDEIAAREEKLFQKAMRESLKEQGSAAPETKEQVAAPAAVKTEDQTSASSQHSASRGMHPQKKAQSGHVPARRKLTEEEIAAKEERMLQKALRESTKDQSAPAPVPAKKGPSLLRRHANRKKQEELRKKEERMLQEALKASLS